MEKEGIDCWGVGNPRRRRESKGCDVSHHRSPEMSERATEINRLSESRILETKASMNRLGLKPVAPH